LYLVVIGMVISCMVLIIPSYRRLALTETMARNLQAGNIKAAIVATDEAAYMTGAELTVDGGLLAGSAAAPKAD
ncbi:hypothetical protein LCGC14_2018160, partial [marine sediment metagenome]